MRCYHACSLGPAPLLCTFREPPTGLFAADRLLECEVNAFRQSPVLAHGEEDKTDLLAPVLKDSEDDQRRRYVPRRVVVVVGAAVEGDHRGRGGRHGDRLADRERSE